MDADPYRRKLHYRAHHRGTREADAMVGGFFDHCSAEWGEAEYAWFERLLEEQDVDIMAWASIPNRLCRECMEQQVRLSLRA